LTVGARESATSRLVYLYGFVEGKDRAISAALADVAGLDPGTAVTLVSEGPIAAVTSDVPAEEFSGEELARKLNEIGSLEAIARAHARVLDGLVARATVLPARLATLYRTEDDVRRLIIDQGAVFTRAFRRLHGVREWGVKMFVERARLLQWIEAASADGSESSAGAVPSGGAAYLAERQRRQALEQRYRDEVLARADEVHRTLRGLATEVRLVTTHAALPGEEAGELGLSAAYLVPREREDELRALTAAFARRFDERGILVTATGPWPPYNFLDEALS
jgi:hypothetical protein